MGRRPRFEAHGAIHHVVPQGNGRRPIVLDDADRRSYLERFHRVAADHRWLVHSSTLLDTHHHAIVETPEPNLGRGMRYVIGGHAAWFNARHDRSGAVFGDRYWSRRVYDEDVVRACLYVLLNPVAAGLVSHPRDWPWSSYRSLVSDGCSPRLASFFEGDADVAFLELVDDAVALVLESRAHDQRSVLRIARNLTAACAGRGRSPRPTVRRR